MGCGYRLMLDYFHVWRIIRRLQPQVVEVGDSLPSGLVCLAMRWTGRFRGLLSSFYHSDPIETWIVPWAKSKPASKARQLLARWADRFFYRLQNSYDTTIVTSRSMRDHLEAKGVSRLVRKPFGVDPIFCQSASSAEDVLGNWACQHNGDRKTRLLFVGRLIKDKAVELLWQTLPAIMSLPEVELTVLGSGLYEKEFRSAKYPGFHYLGYVSDRRQMAEIYRQHDILLAPGPYETFGLAVLEAMASGLVVVGPDRGGTAELLSEAKSPFIFRAQDAEDFLRTVLAVVRADLAKHRAAARETAQHYGTWNDSIGRLVEFYQQVVEKHPSQATKTWRHDDVESVIPGAVTESSRWHRSST